MSEGHVPTPAADESLFAMLAARARRATDGQLVASAIGGLVVSVAIALLLPSWWPLAMPPIVVAAFGGWGIADRSSADVHSGRRPAISRSALAALRWTSLIVGTIAAALFGLALTAVLVGTWRS